MVRRPDAIEHIIGKMLGCDDERQINMFRTRRNPTTATNITSAAHVQTHAETTDSFTSRERARIDDNIDCLS